MHGTFHWNELMTRDVGAAKHFYGGTLGWTFQQMDTPDGPYWVAMVGDRAVAGLFQMAAPEFEGTPANWMPYIAVDDVDASIAAAQAAGAEILRPCFDVPGVGRIAILKDPTGAVLGWMTPVAGM